MKSITLFGIALLAGFGIFSAVQFTFAQTDDENSPSPSPSAISEPTSVPSPLPSSAKETAPPSTDTDASATSAGTDLTLESTSDGALRVTNDPTGSTNNDTAADFSQISGSHLTNELCESNGNLSYEQAMTAIVSGKLGVRFYPDLESDRISAKIENMTDCPVPLSLGVYKLFGPYSPETLSSQQFHSGSATVLVGGGSNASLDANIPDCMFQADIWYGDVQRILVDNRVYGEFLAGDLFRLDEYCIRTPIAPSPVALRLPTPTATPLVTDSGPYSTTTVPVATSTTPATTVSPAPVRTIEAISRSGGRARPIILASAPAPIAQSGSPYFPTLPDAGFAPFAEGPMNDVMPYAIPMVIMIVIGMIRIPFIKRDAF